MPDRNLTQTAVEAMTAPETAAVFLTLLTIKVDGETVLRLVDDKQELVSGGETFSPCAFSATLPEQSDSGSQSCKLQIDNTDIAIFKAIKSAAGKEITADVAVVISTSPDVYEQGPLSFVLRNVTANEQTVSAELYDGYMADRKFTAMTYSPEHFPGMFF